MSRRYRDYDSYYPPYVPVAERRRKAEQAAKKLAKEQDIKPVVIQGRTLAKSWWGKEWNANLERYSDFSNRLPRGRSYARHGSVLHLDIQAGCVEALVQGSGAKPYEVTIAISKLKPETWEHMIAGCAGQLESVRDLIAGRFPKDLASLFTAKGSGLFPAPEEIELSCSCPDWAVMCKHVAAALYGVGARLDDDPSLFFTLRQVDQTELVSQAVDGVAKALTERAKTGSDRVLKDEDLGDVFGIDMDGVGLDLVDAGGEYEGGEFIGAALPTPVASPPPDAPRREKSGKAEEKRKTKRSRSGRSKKKTKKAGSKTPKTSGRSAAPARRRGSRKTQAERAGSLLEQVLAALARFPDGATAFDLIADTSFKESQIRNAIARARAQGQVHSSERGLYILKR